jgi:hypothetical protein
MEAAPRAVAALIRSGDDARSLFAALRCFGADFDEPLEALAELGSLLDAWESHLPAGHRSGDAPFWSDVAAVCGDVDRELDDAVPDFKWGSAKVLFDAIAEAAISHLNAATSHRW